MNEEEIDQAAMIHRLPVASVVDRQQFLVGLAEGRRVIHIGFADAGCRSMQDSRNTWLHALLAERADSIVGLDVDEPGVAAAQASGFEAHIVDCRDTEAVRDLRLEPADVVIAGEVIEHIDAPGPFLDAIAQLVVPDGELVLTTPNSSGLGNALAAVAGFEVQHPGHVTLFSCRTLTALMESHRWSVTDTRTYVSSVKPTIGPISLRTRIIRVGGRALLAMERLLGWMGRPFAADGLIVVGRRAGPSEKTVIQRSDRRASAGAMHTPRPDDEFDPPAATAPTRSGVSAPIET